MSIEALVNFAVATAEIGTGAPGRWTVARRGRMARLGRKGGRSKAAQWTEEEYKFLDDHLGVMTMEEIAERLGRSVNGIRVKKVRKGMAAASKRPGYLTGQAVATALGVDIHAVMTWKDRGMMALEVVPGARGIMRIEYEKVKRWAVNPENWIYFKARKVRDVKIRRLIEMRRLRWGDEWVTTGEIARRLGLGGDGKTVEVSILRGHLKGKRWGNWFIKWSVVKGYTGWRVGSGAVALRWWSDRSDAFLLRMLAEGKSYKAIGRMMKRSGYLVSKRAMELRGCEHG